MRVTIADIARQAGVSKATVSRVLNGKPDVDEVTAQRIRRIVTETGYTPSARAVGLARGRTQIVGVLVPSLSWPWMAELLQGVVEVVEAAGYGMLLYTTTRGQESLDQFASQMSSNSFDGLVVIEPPNTLNYIAGLYRKGLPVVLIDDRGHHPEFPSVVTTNVAGGQQAATHLAATGRRRPAMVTGPREYGAVRDRERGFRDGMLVAGVTLDGRLVVEADFTEQGGFDATEELLAAGRGFDGLFAHNDLMAVGALRALRGRGIYVPEPVGVVGFDDIPMAAHTEPPLTTIRQPCREMGEAAARTLLSHLAGQPMPTQPVVLPTSLVVRRSAPSAESASDLSGQRHAASST